MSKAEDMFRSSLQWREECRLQEEILPEWRCPAATCTDKDTCIDTSADRKSRSNSAASARARLGDLIFYGGLLAARTTKESAPNEAEHKGGLGGGPVIVERLGMLDLPGVHADECE